MRWRTDIGGLYFYGTIFDLPSAIIHRVAGKDLFSWRPFLMALSGILAIPAVAKIGRRLGGNPVAAFSVASLLLMPQFFGHAFINCKDIPLATAIAWSVVGILRLTANPSLGNFALCGLLFGLTLSVRIGGIMVFIFFGATLAALGLRSLLRESLFSDLEGLLRPRILVGALLVGLIAWGLLVSLWPYAHQNPLVNPIEAFRQSTGFPTAYPVLYAGEVYESTNLPWHYLPWMLMLTMPVPILMLALTGMFLTAVLLFVRWKTPGSEVFFLLLFWLGFPLAYVVLRHPNIYDGIRHFLFLLPAIALMSGLAAARIASVINGRLAHAGTLSMILLLASGLPSLALWHPYQYAYYNSLAGTRATLHERYETDYWATSYREAALILHDRQTPGAPPPTVLVGANALSIPCFSYYADKGTRIGIFLGLSGDDPFPADLDYTVAIPRYGMWKNFPDAPLETEIRRNGVLMCTIRRKPEQPPLPSGPIRSEGDQAEKPARQAP
ncbi:MAG: ArnT family glycosyltransferase [Terrimicrobiaceae bacterium]